MNATATITTRPIHTLTSHILHSIHNQGIFIKFPVLLLQLLECKHYYHERYQYQSQQFQRTVLTQ